MISFSPTSNLALEFWSNSVYRCRKLSCCKPSRYSRKEGLPHQPMFHQVTVNRGLPGSLPEEALPLLWCLGAWAGSSLCSTWNTWRREFCWDTWRKDFYRDVAYKEFPSLYRQRRYNFITIFQVFFFLSSFPPLLPLLSYVMEHVGIW